jgi:hypothetical protein
LRQKLFLERYERVKQAEDERIRNRGLLKRGVDWMFPGVMSAATEAQVLAKLDEQLYKDLEDVGVEPGLLDRPAPETRIPEGLIGEGVAAAAVTTSGNGGVLDRTAQGASDAAEKSAKSWASWLGWR